MLVSSTASEETRGDSGGEDAAEDELDRLLDAYEAEADAARHVLLVKYWRCLGPCGALCRIVHTPGNVDRV